MGSFKMLIILFMGLSMNIGFVLSDCSSLDKMFYIQYKGTRLVLASRNSGVDFEPYDPSIYYAQYQQWNVEVSPRTGLFTIQVRYSVGALDFDKETYEIARYDETDSIYQEWFLNSDGTIVNGALSGYAITVNSTSFGDIDKIYLAPLGEPGADQLFELFYADEIEKQFVS
ncbi:hypothetical protein Zmor_019998 [Zophobas morio]|uniref:Uncharacterized protein n=1 Tax=Zophobas morio TaxID=2755281 RepID=A0AA38I4L1_9CUCU|nr:hypothetical protein Zmor_019998 [Zophobas morio]